METKKVQILKLTDGTTAEILITKEERIIASPNYWQFLNRKTGVAMRWGKTQGEDPNPQLGLPEIADIEISTVCHGTGKCQNYCYKSNTSLGTYMTLSTFEKLLAKLPSSVGQIAFGIGDIDSNPDMWDIFDACRKKSIVPNLTVNGEGITTEIAERLETFCGAVAVSHYETETTLDAVCKLTMAGLAQVNIHQMLSVETLPDLHALIEKRDDSRLKNLNAIVLLSLKPKGRAENNFTQVPQSVFTNIVKQLRDVKIPHGFDSCGAQKYVKALMYLELTGEIPKSERKRQQLFIEPCESSLFSMYVNVKGEYFPCSFIEDTQDWEKGLDILSCDNFLEDIWWNPLTQIFRDSVIKCHEKGESCPRYKI